MLDVGEGREKVGEKVGIYAQRTGFESSVTSNLEESLSPPYFSPIRVDVEEHVAAFVLRGPDHLPFRVKFMRAFGALQVLHHAQKSLDLATRSLSKARLRPLTTCELKQLVD